MDIRSFPVSFSQEWLHTSVPLIRKKERGEWGKVFITLWGHSISFKHSSYASGISSNIYLASPVLKNYCVSAMLIVGHNLTWCQDFHSEGAPWRMTYWAKLVVKASMGGWQTEILTAADPPYERPWLALWGFAEAVPWQGLGTPTTCNLSLNK